MFPKTLLLAFGATAYAAVHDSVNGIPHGWQASPHSVPENAAMKLFVSLQYQNLDQLQSQLEAVSTPGSPLYGQYQDVNEQAAMFAPAPDAASKVMAWLKQHNAANIQRTGNMVSFTSSVGQVNKMLNTTFQMYTDGQKSRLRTTEYSIPSDLTSFVDTISPTTYFGDMKPESPMPSMPELDLEVEKRQVDPSCQTPYVSPSTGNKFLLFTPECAKELYNTKGYKADPRSGSNIAFANFLGQSPNYADLAQFEDYFNIPPQNFTILALINGGVNDQDPATATNGEADLDVEYIIGLSDGLPVYTYITGGKTRSANSRLWSSN